MKADFRLVNDRIYVRTPYAPVLVEAIRQIPSRRWHAASKEWSVDADRQSILAVCDAVGILPTMLPGDLARLVRTPENHLQRIDEAYMHCIDGHRFITTPYEHQRRNLVRLIKNNRWILADEMGTGKSHPVINMFGILGVAPILIICPKSCLGTWKDQIREHSGKDSYIIEKYELTEHAADVCPHIVNYEKVRDHIDTFANVNWAAIILDEVHRVKSFTSQTAKAVRKLTARAKYVWGLSGTPAPNGLQDWLGVISAVDPKLLPVQTKTAFEARYCVKRQLNPGGPWIIQGYRNVAELHDYVSQICSRVTKAECLDLPEKIYETRKVKLEGEQRRIYAELKKEAVTRLKEKRLSMTAPLGDDPNANILTVKNILTESLRLLQVVGGFVPSDAGAMYHIEDKAKVAALDDVISEIGDKQAVVWCAFRPEVDFLSKRLQQIHKCKVSVLTGESTSQERIDAIAAFRDGDARFFVGTAAAGGLGINGLQVADTEIYYSRDWNLATYSQSQDRLHRIGQKNQVTIVKLIAEGTVDEKVDVVLDKKAEMQEMLLRNPEEVL